MVNWDYIVSAVMAGVSGSLVFYFIKTFIEDHSRIAANETYIKNFDKHFDKIDNELDNIKNDLKEVRELLIEIINGEGSDDI